MPHRLIFSGSTWGDARPQGLRVARVGCQSIDMGAASGCANLRTDRKGLDGVERLILVDKVHEETKGA